MLVVQLLPSGQKTWYVAVHGAASQCSIDDYDSCHKQMKGPQLTLQPSDSSNSRISSAHLSSAESALRDLQALHRECCINNSGTDGRGFCHTAGRVNCLP